MTECDSGLPEGEARCLAVWGGLSRHCRNGRERLAPGRGACGGLPAPLERQELGPPGRGPISLEKWGKEHPGLCPWTPWGKEFLSPTPLFSGLL